MLCNSASSVWNKRS